jgi:serine/threonine-protein kinase
MLPLVCPVCDARYPAEFRVCPRDAARLEDADGADDDPLIGALLGETYQVVRAIGEGGTARVYEARHVRLPGKRFAVKVLHNFHCSQPTSMARFQREAEAAAAIGHANVVDVYDVHRAPDGRPYLVTELLDGRDFGSLLKERCKVDVGLAVHVARRACAALAAAHAHGVVHRDMKPENVFVIGSSERPIVKVLDFGISKVVDGGGASLTRTGMVVGTPAYMSPEQASGAKVDHRTDVYAVGAMLYRALTGRAPFQGDEMAEVLSGVLTLDPPRPRSLEPSIPDGLELVIQRAMAKNPAERFASMDELDAALADFETPSAGAEGTEIAPVSASGSRRGEIEVRRARPRAIAFSAVLYVWAVACLSDVVLRMLGPGAGATRVIGVLGVVALVLAGPFWLWIRHLAQFWQNTLRVLEIASLLRAAAVYALVAPAVAFLLLRLGVAGGSAFAVALVAEFAAVSLGSSVVAVLAVWQLGRLRHKARGG